MEALWPHMAYFYITNYGTVNVRFQEDERKEWS